MHVYTLFYNCVSFYDSVISHDYLGGRVRPLIYDQNILISIVVYKLYARCGDGNTDLINLICVDVTRN